MILVTGGTGFLGSELIKQLTDKGLTVRALRRAKSKVPALIKDIQLIEWFEADINEPSILEDAFEGITKVYHCAAFVSFNPKDKKQLFHVNIEGVPLTFTVFKSVIEVSDMLSSCRWITRYEGFYYRPIRHRPSCSFRHIYYAAFS